MLPQVALRASRGPVARAILGALRYFALLLILPACGRVAYEPRETDRTDAGADRLDAGALDSSHALDASHALDGRVAVDAPHPLDAGVQDAGAENPNVIFMTSASFTGNLDGRAGANNLCQRAADEAGLEGTYVALLWTSTDDPTTALVGSRGWVDLGGTVIGDDPTSLVFANANPVRVDETGAPITDTNVHAWFGGRPEASQTCSDWTDATSPGGIVLSVSAHASFNTDTYNGCNASARLLCAEIGHVAPLAPPRETGRVAFVSTTLFRPGGGLAAADAVCQGDAVAAGLSGTYRAFLASSGASAGERFDPAGLPWRRVDGVRITETAAELVGAAPIPVWRSFIGRTATGAVTNARAWTGTATQNCADWTNGSTELGSMGSTHTTVRAALQLFPNVGCGSALPLICLER